MAARPEFPAVLRSRRGDGLPLHVGNCVGAAAGERHDVILPVARACASGSPESGSWRRRFAWAMSRYSRSAAAALLEETESDWWQQTCSNIWRHRIAFLRE